MAYQTTPYQRLLDRRAIPGRSAAAYAKFSALAEQEDIKYLLDAMEAMDGDYTKTTLAEAERVHKYLEPFSTIRLQGSVTTDTHIRYFSDVDILTITEDFTTWETFPSGCTRWGGDPIATLRDLRAKCRVVISREFPAVKIEDKDRSLALTGGSLRRNVDVVTANWYNTDAYARSSAERDRGIQVLDISVPGRILNKPFLHQHLLREKDAATVGGANRAIRLLKTLKEDASTKIDISSYDICALVWNMDNLRLPGGVESSFILANNVEGALLGWVTNEQSLNALSVPNQTRKIVDSKEGTSLVAVTSLWHELYVLLERIKKSGKKLDRSLHTFGNIVFQ